MTTRVRARLLFAAVLHLGVLHHATTAQEIQRLPIRVWLEPIVEDEVSGVAWNALFQECARIWALEGVEVRWPGKEDGAPPHVTLPLVFDGRELKKHDPARQEALGVTLFAGRSQRIVVSVARARRVVAMRRGLADSGDAMSLDIAFGRVMGRVVAHEIGHALLLTRTHAPYGLMAPEIDARDAQLAEPLQFALSLDDRQRLATRFSLLAVPAPRAAVAAPLLTGTAAANREAAVTPVTWTAVPAPSRPRERR
jgi:hypothetical protein